MGTRQPERLARLAAPVAGCSIPHNPRPKGGPMPVGVLQMTPGGTKEQYEQVGEKMFGVRSSEFDSAEAPDGLLMHTAGPTEGGWYVYDVWQSREHVQRFFEGRLMPALQEVGAPMGDPPQFFEIESLVVTDAARTK